MLRPMLAVLATLLALTQLAAQVPGSWVQLNLTSRPFARERHAMVFDNTRNESVLFGGFNGAYMNDTWVLGPAGWTQRLPATSPPARAGHAMAFDPVRQCTVLVGGTNGSPLLDVWEWDGSNWTQRATSVVGLGEGGSAAFDPLNGSILYNRGNANLRWDGMTATVVNVAQPTGIGGPMVFHAPSGGPLQSAGSVTVRFQAPTGWGTIGTTQAFSLNSTAMAYDPIGDRLLLQGGQGSVGGSSTAGQPYTWEWNGGHWSEVSNGSPLLHRHAMVFDVARGTFVLFGGRHNNGSLVDTTYEWSAPSYPASWAAFGAGCSGSAPQTPRLLPDALWNSAPMLGGVFLARADRLPPGQPVLGAIGFSNQTWSGGALPLPLDIVGMSGCELLVSPDATLLLGLSSTSGTAGWATAIPGLPGILGLQFFQQVLVLAPGANPAGVLWSNGGHGVVGN